MEKKTRVQRYQELRQNIEEMTDYPFQKGDKSLSDGLDDLLMDSQERKDKIVMRHQKKESKLIRFQACEKGKLIKLATIVLVLVLLFVLILVLLLYATGVLS